MCRILQVSKSGYYKWLNWKPSKRVLEEGRLEVEIKAAHQRTRETFGPERLQHELKEQGVKVGISRIRRIRNKLGLRCKQKRKFRATTDSKHAFPVAENLLNQQTQIDGGGVQGVGRLIQFDTEGIVGVEATRLADEDLGKIDIDSPIPDLIGMSKGVS
jgi:putative transposase